MSPISETELNAYVDGESFPERQALIAAGSFLAGAGVACLAGYWIA